MITPLWLQAAETGTGILKEKRKKENNGKVKEKLIGWRWKWKNQVLVEEQVQASEARNKWTLSSGHWGWGKRITTIYIFWTLYSSFILGGHSLSPGATPGSRHGVSSHHHKPNGLLSE